MSFQPPVIILDRGDLTTLTVNLYGGTIVSWRIKNKEMLFLPSGTSDFDGLRVIFGGIKYTFPQFGFSTLGPKHGFTRNTTWAVEEPPRRLPNRDVRAVISLENNEFTRAIWDYYFKISYTIVLGASKLNLYLSIKNTSPCFPFYFKVMCNTMLRVDSLIDCKMLGLTGCIYFTTDKDGQKTRQFDTDTYKTFDEFTNEHLRIYEDVPEQVLLLHITETKSARYVLGPTTLNGHPRDTLEMLVWNPYYERVLDKRAYSVDKRIHENFRELRDNCLGLGVGIINNEVRLTSGSEFRTAEEIEVLDEEELARHRIMHSASVDDQVEAFC